MSSSPPPPSFTAEDFPLGRTVHVVLKSKREFTGEVFALDLASNRLILEAATSTTTPDDERRDSIFINLASVAASTLLHPPPPPGKEEEEEEEELFPLTQELAARREKHAFQVREAALLKAPRSSGTSSSGGGGARPSQLGQDLYNALAKTYECRWRANLVLEVVALGVVVKPPYRHNDVSGQDNRAVIRVKELLGKIQLKH